MLFLSISFSIVDCKRDYITWDDLKLDIHKPTTNSDYLNKQLSAASHSSSYNISSNENDVTVIVVDPNGGADSLTVQAAVDLVPCNNTRRVKIFILPGIYRFKLASQLLVPFSGNCFKLQF